MAYTKLANSILTSTVWMENDQTRIVWLTLLAMADQHGEVQASIPGLANVARVSISACESAIKTFMTEDPYSRTKTDGGKRLIEIDGGWFVINHEKYRELASDNDRKKKAAERQKRHRDRVKAMETVTCHTETVTCHAKSVTDNAEIATGCDKSHQNPQAEAEAEAEADAKKTSSSDSEAGVRRKIRFDEWDIGFAKRMFSMVIEVASKEKEPNFEKWANEIRLMRERDERTPQEIESVFRWANQDSFWRTNILCPAKLRSQFATLDAKMRSPGKNGTKQTLPSTPVLSFRDANA